MASGPSKGIWIPIGASTKELNAALAEAGIQLNMFKGKAEDAAGGMHAFEQGLKGTQREMRGHDRMVNFYVKQLAEIIPVGAGAKGAIAGIAGAASEAAFSFGKAVTPLGMMILAFEGIKAVVSVFEYMHDKSLKNAESLAKLAEQYFNLKNAIEDVARAESGRAKLSGPKQELKNLSGMRAVWEESEAIARQPGATGADKTNAADQRTIFFKMGGFDKERILQAQVRAEELREQNESLRRATEFESKRLIIQAKGSNEFVKARVEYNAEMKMLEMDALTERIPTVEEFYSRQAEIQAKYNERVLNEQHRIQAALQASFEKGNMEYEMAGGDNGVLLKEEHLAAGELKRLMDEFDHRLKAYELEVKPSEDMDPKNMLGSKDKDVRITSFKEAMGEGKSFKDQLSGIADAAANIGNAFSSWGDIVGGAGGKILKVLGSMFSAAAAVAIAMAAAAPPPWGIISMAAVAAGLIATIAQVVASPVAPGRRAGGSTSAGSSYWVGEYGPELFTPDASGNITANGDLAGMGGGGLTVNINASALDQAWWNTHQTEIIRTLSDASRNRRI
jgi:hypothetical protein